MTAIYKREIYSFFVSPIGYVFVAAFLAVSSLVFSYFTFLSGEAASVSSYFTADLIVMMLMIPLLTMKSFSEERKLKTEQLVLTSPVSLPGFVIAKFLASYTVFAGTFLITCINFPIMFSYLSEEHMFKYNGAIALGGCVALLLIGAAFISVGLLISSLTENQIISTLGTLGTLAVLLGASMLNSKIAFAPLRAVLNWVSIYSRFSNFSQGYFDFASIVYYASFSAVCLFITVRIYEKRRWA
jgi:ABC-2 type transport system permease protein